MKRLAKILGGTALLAMLLAVVLAIGVFAVAGTLHPAVIEINGEPVEWARFGAGHGLIALAGMLVAALVVLLVLPFAVVLPLLVVGLVLAGIVLALAGVAALVCSPLLLLAGLGWLIWRLAKRANARERAKAGATIAS